MAEGEIKPDEAWDAAQYEASLARLESLQDQLTALRTTIPSLIRPLTRPNTTKTEAFNGLRKAAVAAVADVKSFRTQWEGQQTQQILSKAKESQTKDKDLAAGREIPIYGWTEGYSGAVAIDSPTVDMVKEEKGT